MLRAHRCRRYAARLKELIRCTPVDPLLLTEGEVTDLACLHADSTRPTAGECLLHDDRSPVLLLSSLHPAPETLWDEDLALLTLLLEHFGLRPSMETGLALYTAVLCRSAGFTDLPDRGLRAPRTARGRRPRHAACRFSVSRKQKSRRLGDAGIRSAGCGGVRRGLDLRSGTDPGCR